MDKDVLIIAYTNLSRDPRPFRQIKTLKEKYNIYTIGTRPSQLEKEFIRLKKNSFLTELIKLPLLLFRLYSFYYWDSYKKKVLKKTKDNNYDIIIVHEIRLVPLALKISKNAKIILDAHEYSPSNFDDSFFWRLLFKKYYTALCNENLKKCNKVITVCDGIANLYKENFGIECEVITNATEFLDIKPKQCNSNKIKIIHHGNASPSRRLELMIDMMNYLDDRFELYLMLIASRVSGPYYNSLKNKAKGNKNIYFIPPVPFEDLVPYCNKFDIGIQFHPPVNINLKFGLGNKFFEFIQSRLAIAIGPSVEMKKYLEKYNLGIVSKSFDPKDMADKLNNLSLEDIMRFKNNIHKNALKLSSKTNDKKFLKIVEGLL